MARSKKNLNKENFANSKMENVSFNLMNPAPYNPRKISDESREALGNSLKHFGYVEPIVWNKKTGNVVSGHQRMERLIANGFNGASVIVLNIDEQEEKSLNVTLNNPFVGGEWNEKLSELLSEIASFDLEFFQEVNLKDLAEEMDIPIFDLENDNKTEKKDWEREVEINFKVVIDCEDENEQKNLILEFESRGVKCQALIV